MVIQVISILASKVLLAPVVHKRSFSVSLSLNADKGDNNEESSSKDPNLYFDKGKKRKISESDSGSEEEEKKRVKTSQDNSDKSASNSPDSPNSQSQNMNSDEINEGSPNSGISATINQGMVSPTSSNAGPAGPAGPAGTVNQHPFDPNNDPFDPHDGSRLDPIGGILAMSDTKGEANEYFTIKARSINNNFKKITTEARVNNSSSENINSICASRDQLLKDLNDQRHPVLERVEEDSPNSEFSTPIPSSSSPSLVPSTSNQGVERAQEVNEENTNSWDELYNNSQESSSSVTTTSRSGSGSNARPGPGPGPGPAPVPDPSSPSEYHPQDTRDILPDTEFPDYFGTGDD